MDDRQIPRLPRARGTFVRYRGIYQVEIDASHRQLVLLALAELQHARPGWAYAIGEAAECYPNGRSMLASFLELHGTQAPAPSLLQDVAILAEVAEERQRQFKQWGQQDHPDHDPCFADATATDYRVLSSDTARLACQFALRAGRVAWAWILLEEFAEVLDARTEDERRAELVQLAALAVQQIGAIDRRKAAQAPQ